MLLAAVVEIRNLGPAQFERAQKFRLVSTELAAAQPTATPPPAPASTRNERATVLGLRRHLGQR